MKAGTSLRIVGVLASVVALVALVMALTPGAQAAGTFKPCANKKITFNTAAEGEKPSPYTVTVKSISVKSATCAEAYEFLRYSYNGEKLGKKGYPLNYSCKSAEFKVPVGYFGTICTKGGKTLKFAQQGG